MLALLFVCNSIRRNEEQSNVEIRNVNARSQKNALSEAARNLPGIGRSFFFAIPKKVLISEIPPRLVNNVP
jgi:hypothetical protein